MALEDTLNPPLVPNLGHLPVVKRWLLSLLARLEYGHLSVYLEGEHYVLGKTEDLQADIHIHHPARLLWKCLTQGDLGFGQAYLAGDWSSTHLTKLLTLLLRNWQYIGTPLDERGQWLRWRTTLLHWLRRNNLSNSRKNIAHHYDMGNDFYQAWLDSSMTYSAGLYKQADASLEQAQHAKYQRILHELKAQPGQRILEIGCGWGGFAELAAQQGYQVHGITLSTQQLAYAQQRLTPYGRNVCLELRDYRHLSETYDHIVSIEMFEAVGEQYWPTYFAQLEHCLKPGGRAVLQIITIGDEWFETYKARPDFIQRYIFPGGMLPSPAHLHTLINASSLRLSNTLTFGLDYARTLAEWDQRFSKALPSLHALGYDQTFERLWRYYLAYCEAGFNEGRIDVVQLTLEKPLP